MLSTSYRIRLQRPEVVTNSRFGGVVWVYVAPITSQLSFTSYRDPSLTGTINERIALHRTQFIVRLSCLSPGIYL